MFGFTLVLGCVAFGFIEFQPGLERIENGYVAALELTPETLSVTLQDYALRSVQVLGSGSCKTPRGVTGKRA